VPRVRRVNCAIDPDKAGPEPELATQSTGVGTASGGEYDHAREVTATNRGLKLFTVALVGSAVLGAIAGLIWGAVSPRVLFQEVAAGQAAQVHAEDSGYIVADAWFCLITAIGGLITGLAGLRLLHRAGWPAAAGLVLGAVGAAYIALWIGGLIGLSTFNHQLATSSTGTYLNASLQLSAKSALAFWPLLTSAVIAVAGAGAGREVVVAEEPPASGMWTPEQADGHSP
jgi:hypothetical protein